MVNISKRDIDILKNSQVRPNLYLLAEFYSYVDNYIFRETTLASIVHIIKEMP